MEWDTARTEKPRAEDVEVASDLDAILRGADDSGDVTLGLVLRDEAWEKGPPISVLEAYAMLDGFILTYGDRDWVRAEAIADREVRGLEGLEPMLALVEELGGRVVSTSGFSATAIVALPADSVETLLGDPDLLIAEPLFERETDAGYGWPVTGPLITGYELEDLLQSAQFYDRGFEGSGQLIGQSEGGAASRYNLHPGFFTFGLPRLWDCLWTGSACTIVYNDPGDPHATAVASILVGDITQGQDPSISAAGVARRERSGVARGAQVVGTPGGANMATALAVFVYAGVDLASQSESGGPSVDPSCLGTWSDSVTVDSMFEAGVLLFKSMSNDGHASSTDCTAGSPAGAIGAFPVSAYYVDAT